MAMTTGKPQLLFGGAAIASGLFKAPEQVQSLIQLLKTLNVHRIDTAPIYPSTSPGQAEELLGRCGPGESCLVVDTKIMVTSLDGKGTLTSDAIDKSINSSLARLKSKINVLYCHIPDPETPVAETAAALDRHFRDNNFSQLGLSNFSPDQVSAYLAVCTQHNYVKPSYYQGQYNALCRGHENFLLPLLRQHKIHYIAYSPLAGGFLTGIFTSGGPNVAGTRFEEGNKTGAFYKRIYDKPEMHDGIRALQKGCEEQGIGLTNAALRWLVWHSALAEGDGAILGASQEEQVKANLKGIEHGKLPVDLVELFEKVWCQVRG